MTVDRDLERLLDTWLSDGPTLAPDRVLDAVAERIDRREQRPAWRLRSWRDFHVITVSKMAAVVAAVVVLAVIGISLVLRPGGSKVGSSGPTTPPSATTAPTPTPTPSPTPGTLTSGVQGPGTFIGKFAASTIPWTVTLPKGWSAYDADVVMGPERGGMGTAVITERAVNVPKDSCAPQGTVPAATAEQFLSAVEARKDWTVSDRLAATIGGYPASRIDIVLPQDTSICGAGKDYMVVAHSDGKGFYLQGPSMHVTYWVADVKGEPLMIERFSFASTPASDVAESDAVVDSIEIIA